MKKILLSTLACITTVSFLCAQSVQTFPSNWWVGMKHNKVQVIFRGEDSSMSANTITVNYPGVTVSNSHKFENKKYICADVTIAANAKPGIIPFILSNGKKKTTVNFTIKARRDGNGTAYAQGVTSSDFIYLLMPDRFSNGDPSIDKVAGMRDQTLNRDSIYHRHGGDFKGVINHLDYLKNLGVTTVWMTPVLENDQPNRTEHGYAFTNHYTIEPRFGGAPMYKNLSDELHKRGMKLIQDAVYNHVGSKHIFFQDPPSNDWFHRWDKYTNTTFKDQVVFDPYASKKDKKQLSDGWFTTEMPDVNQSNPYVATFLIQHAIWSVEEFGVDGWRIDTYLYNDLPFMNHCNDELIKEYPHITMFGETWVHGTPSQSYIAANNYNIPFKSNLIGVTDFQTLFYGITPALNDKFGWTDGVNRLYTTLSNDFLYKNPMNNVIFLDNHDISRFFSTVGEDVNKLEMGLAWMFTCRGIPQLYYGDEVLMKGFTNPDGWVRLDFPGGWEGDKKNAFTGQGLTDTEKIVQNYVKTFANFRKNSSAIKTGKMMQYVPVDGLYIYFRYDNNQTVMCVMNTDEKEKTINFADYSERTDGFTKAKNIADGTILKSGFTIPAKKMWVFELEK